MDLASRLTIKLMADQEDQKMRMANFRAPKELLDQLDRIVVMLQKVDPTITKEIFLRYAAIKTARMAEKNPEVLAAYRKIHGADYTPVITDEELELERRLEPILSKHVKIRVQEALPDTGDPPTE